jgi:uncharacterized protein (TIGR00730 family)
MRKLKSLCIYCGSSPGASAVYAQAARALAKEMVDDRVALVYGGGSVGLMGVVADEVLRLGGDAIGVIPQALMDKEVDHRGLTRLHVVKDMHERKALMAQLADGFIAMPGGMGTLEELFEALTWSQLGFHDKPVGLLNVDGFYDGLIRFIGHVVMQRFLKAEHASLMMHAPDAPTLLARLKSFEPAHHSKWLDRSTAKTLLP